MISGSNQRRYGKLVEEFQNYFAKGNDNCPANTTEAYNLLVKYKTTYSNTSTILVDKSEEVLLVNVRGTEGGLNSYKSGRVGGDCSDMKV